MKILQIIPVYSLVYGGPVTIVHEVTKRLISNHEVVTYTTTSISPTIDINEKRTIYKNSEVYYFKRNFRFISRSNFFGQFNISFSMMKYLQKNIKRFNIVHIYSYQQFFDLITAYYAIRNRIPYIIQVNGSLTNNDSKFIQKFIYNKIFGYHILKNAKKVIAISGIEKEQYKKLGVLEKNIEIISPGINYVKYNNLPNKLIFKKKHNLDLDIKIILYFGRINQTKGLDFLIESYYNFISKYNSDKVILVIAGMDDGYLPNVILLINKLNLNKLTLILSGLSESEKIELMVDSEIVVNVEPINIYGIVPLEAGACGKPVIVTQGNEIKNVVIKGDFGFVVKYGDIDSMLHIFNLIIKNNQLLIEKGKNGRNYVLKNYNWDDIVKKLNNIYSSIG